MWQEQSMESRLLLALLGALLMVVVAELVSAI
jgi:hypothetical protein